MISGAMIASMVEQAVSFAMQRCIDAGNSTGEGEGVTRDDMVLAIHRVFSQNLALNHQDALDEFARDERGQIVGLKRLSQSTK